MSDEAPWRAHQSLPEYDELGRGLAGAAEIRTILTRARTVAMVGLSADQLRPSFFVAVYLLATGYTVLPINPRYAGESILGCPVFASLCDVPEHVDVVDVFRRPADVLPIVDDAIAIGAGVLWLQLGVINEEAADRARQAGLTVVMDRCIKVEHGRHLGAMRSMGFCTGVITARRRRLLA
jgi:predicted CoA-binding protein